MKGVHITDDLKLIIDYEKIDFKTDKGLKYKRNIENFRKRVKRSFGSSDEVYCYLDTENILSKEDFIRDFFVDTWRYQTHYSNINCVKDSDIDLDIFRSKDTYKEKIKYVRYFYKELLNLYYWCDVVITEVSEDYLEKQFTLYTEKWIKEMKKDEYILYLKNFNRELIQSANKKNTKSKETLKQRTYILKDNNTGFYKIGKSINPKERERTLQSEKPTIKMVKEFKTDIESKLHKKYNEHRVRGEWFDLNIVQLKYICTNYK